MKRNQSILETAISSFYFAVQPLSLSFFRDYNSSFNLYFEKGLQIISKNESRNASPRKDEIVAFAPPSTVPHFRIQSDKNLEYEWSLYASQQEGDEHEEFVEGQKVSLKAAWQQFQELKIGVWEGQLEFNAIKFVIARNTPELQQTVQQHLQLLGQPAPPPKQEKAPISNKIIEVQQEEGGSAQDILKLDSPKKESVVSEAPLPVAEMKESKILNEYPTPERPEGESPKRVSATREREHPLSLSELNIAQAVGQEVESYEASKAEKVETIAEVVEVPEVAEAAEVVEETPPPVAELQPETKEESPEEIRMTSSQLLDEKRQVIIPPPKSNRNKIIVLAIILALIFSAIGYFSLKVENKPQPANERKVEGKAKPVKAAKEAKEAKTAKEVKGAKQAKAKESKEAKGRRQREK